MLEVLRHLNGFTGTPSDVKLTIQSSNNTKKGSSNFHIIATFGKKNIDKKYEWKTLILKKLEEKGLASEAKVLGLEEYYEYMMVLHDKVVPK